MQLVGQLPNGVFRLFVAGASPTTRFLLSPIFALFPIEFRWLLILYYTCFSDLQGEGDLDVAAIGIAVERNTRKRRRQVNTRRIHPQKKTRKIQQARPVQTADTL